MRTMAAAVAVMCAALGCGKNEQAAEQAEALRGVRSNMIVSDGRMHVVVEEGLAGLVDGQWQPEAELPPGDFVIGRSGNVIVAIPIRRRGKVLMIDLAARAVSVVATLEEPLAAAVVTHDGVYLHPEGTKVLRKLDLASGQSAFAMEIPSSDEVVDAGPGRAAGAAVDVIWQLADGVTRWYAHGVPPEALAFAQIRVFAAAEGHVTVLSWQTGELRAERRIPLAYGEAVQAMAVDGSSVFVLQAGRLGVYAWRSDE